ncbi:MAG TPA: hypothetical protein VNH11_26745 [Pirellulales bacterium]|nr:hypothetical protein [Pirellulales bacterium]
MESLISRYWPFDVGDQQRHSEQDKREVRFLEKAYSLGYRPYEISLGMQSYGATALGGRTAEILYRGRNGWEVAVHDQGERVVKAFVNDFECAAQAVLDWLGGGQEADVVARVEGHLATMPGLRPGHELVVRSSPVPAHPRSR